MDEEELAESIRIIDQLADDPDIIIDTDPLVPYSEYRVCCCRVTSEDTGWRAWVFRLVQGCG